MNRNRRPPVSREVTLLLPKEDVELAERVLARYNIMAGDKRHRTLNEMLVSFVKYGIARAAHEAGIEAGMSEPSGDA